MDKILPIGDRMKQYYEETTNFILVRRTPIIVRVDGRCFHSLTRKCQKPFDQLFINSMVCAAANVAKEIQGFKAAYVQSDEASFLLTDYDNLNTEGWFRYELRKIISISASLMATNFVAYFIHPPRPISFDARAFNVPREDVSNYFLWRTQDWARNSLQMYSHSFFSHKQLHKKNMIDMHEMLHGIDKNWTTDLSEQVKNGTWILNKEGGFEFRHDILPKYGAIDEIIQPLVAGCLNA